MPQITVYHNPKCSKSRQTLTILQEQGIEPTIIEYLKTPPSSEELTALIAKLDMVPSELVRTGEKEYRSLNLDDAAISDAELILAMVEHPILIQRPIVVNNGKAVIGRPPEKVLEILQ